MIDSLYRPLIEPCLPGVLERPQAYPLAGGALRFAEAVCIPRGGSPYRLPADEVPPGILDQLTRPRSQISGLDLSRPQIMGIVNVTPDSFSDGGQYGSAQSAVDSALQMYDAGASLLDVGGESTRPGAITIADQEEIDRVVPVIEGIRQRSDVVVSVDTRKAAVARAALAAGADLVNDVSGFTYDSDLSAVCASAGVPVCVMHSQGDPETMQDDPTYESVLHDVYAALDGRLTRLEGQGIERCKILVDPGIGFGKTQVHNLDLLRNIGVFHGLGAGILLGVSRKGFIGRIGQEPVANRRAPGSIALGLAALGEGVQILRVHDVAQTVQAVRLWHAIRDAGAENT